MAMLNACIEFGKFSQMHVIHRVIVINISSLKAYFQHLLIRYKHYDRFLFNFERIEPKSVINTHQVFLCNTKLGLKT